MIKEPAVYLHCFPQYSQGKKAIWNSVHNTDYGDPMQYLDHFPPELIKYKNATEMRIQLFNGAVYCVMGLDGKNAQLARGMNPTHVILSEYAYMDPESWYTIEPRVSQNKGTAIFLSTPNGQNHFYQLLNYAKTSKHEDWFASILTNEETKVHSPTHIQSLRDQGIPEDFIQQEYFCSFTRGAEGSYYGKLIQKARDEERLTKVQISKDLTVHTSWDIGRGDATAIWLFQVHKNGTYRFLHYYENTGEGLDHYFHYLDNWKQKNGIIWGSHFFPHDMKHGELTGDRVQLAIDMGYTPIILKPKKVEEGIQAVRSLLPHCIFDAIECKRGIQCLDFYRKKWNESLKTYYDEPLHDQWSHGSDSFRYAAMGLKDYGDAPSGKLTPDKIREMRMNNLGY